MAHCLTAEAVSFSYTPGEDVFAHVSCTVSDGQLLGIVGPNGSGKSTLLRVLCGLLKAREGRVALDGQAIGTLNQRARARQIAFLPQAVNPVFALTVFEVVCLGRYPHLGALGALEPHDRAVAERCLHDTDTWPLRARAFQSLSGGERQRVLLASILAQEAGLLLLDEPTSALDIHHQVEIFAQLKRLSRAGFGVAVVTHDLNMAARYCDRVLLMSDRFGDTPAGPPLEVFTADTLSAAYGAAIEVDHHPRTGAMIITAACAEEAAP